MSFSFAALLPHPWWRDVSSGTIRADLFAGLTGATVVLPQAVAFASIAGLPPQYGLYAAIVTPIVAAIFGSSMVMVSGPTTAISAIVFSSLAGIIEPGTPLFFQTAVLLAVLVGIIQFALGIFGLGRLIAFVSHSVMLGFMSAAAILIAVSQLGPAMGISISAHSVFERLVGLANSIDQAQWPAIMISASALIIALIAKRISGLLPHYLIGLIGSGIVAHYFAVEGADIRMVGELPDVVPVFAVPNVNWSIFTSVLESAIAVSLVALLEAVSIGRAFAPKTGHRFNANQEIVAQGLSNVAGGLFGAYPGSGSFTRSGINFSAGAKTPLAAIFASLFLVILLLNFGFLIAHIPLAGLAGLILLVAWNLLSPSEVVRLFKTDRTEAWIVTFTFASGVFLGLEIAILVGVLISLLVFLSKSSKPNLIVIAPEKAGVFRNAQLFKLQQCPQAVFVRLDGPLYFGSAEAVERGLQSISRLYPRQKHVVLILKGVGDVDLSGGQVLIDEAERIRKRGGALHIVIRYAPLEHRLRQIGVFHAVGEDHIYQSKGDAIRAIVDLADRSICQSCSARIFRECQGIEKAA